MGILTYTPLYGYAASFGVDWRDLIRSVLIASIYLYLVLRYCFSRRPMV